MNFVFAPVFKKFQFDEQLEISKMIAFRFSLFAWPIVAVLLATGFYKLPYGILGNLSSRYGLIIHLKFFLVTLMVTLGLYLTGYLGSKAKRISQDDSSELSDRTLLELKNIRKIMPRISLTISLIGILVIYLISII